MNIQFQPVGGKGPPDASMHIGLLLWPGFSLLALSGLMEALDYAGRTQKRSRQGAFKLSLLSEFPDKRITSSTGISVSVDSPHVSPERFSHIVVIGGSLHRLEEGDYGDIEYLNHAYHAHIPLVGIGSGSFILAQEGMLNERRASIHPHMFEAFCQRFPQVYAEQGYDFIDEGDVITCPGGISTMTFATELIRHHVGDESATNACKQFSLVSHDAATPQPPNIARIPDPRLRRAVLNIEQYLTRPLTTAWLAHDVQLSERQLNRLFHAEFGKNTREFIRYARLRYACWLLKNSQQSVTHIAQRMGFSDSAHFIRHFQLAYGCSPGVWRSSTCLSA